MGKAPLSTPFFATRTTKETIALVAMHMALFNMNIMTNLETDPITVVIA